MSDTRKIPKVAVVTGGTAGIGLATALEFAGKGWSVGVIARDPDRVREVETRLRGMGVRALGLSADVADDKALNDAADRMELELGPISAWVNNAMSTVISPADKITPDEYRRVTETTYLSQVFGTLAALRHMKKRDRGAIVQVSSGLAIRSIPLQAAYCGAKHAISGFTDSVRSELAHNKSKVTISVVYLPTVNTPQFGWARTRTGHHENAPPPVFDPRLAAKAIVFGAENPRREIWVGRSVLQMVAAQTLIPAIADNLFKGGWELQLGKPMAPNEGNLFKAAPGPAKVDGPFPERMEPTMTEFWTSRHRDAVVGGVVALAILGIPAMTRLLGRTLRGLTRI